MNDYIKQINKPTIKLDPIKFESPSSTEDTKKITKGLGFTPFLWYMGYQIRETNISYLKLYHDGILPKVKVTFTDEYDTIEDTGFPENDTPFEMFLNSGSDTIKSIHIKFKIEDFKSSASKKYTMYGTLDLTDLYINQYKAFRNKTSFSTLKDICKEMGLGFNSNVTDTKDSMTWIQRGDNIDFIRNIMKRSYISDESYLIGYIDYYYCFNYLDIEKELNRDISNDVNIDTSSANKADSDNVKETTKLDLTNDKGNSSSNLFIESYKILNNSMSSAIDNGFFIKTRYYDSLNKTHLLFNIDSITDKDDGKIIVLKGKQNDKDYYDRNVSNNWMGKIDTDNVHQNYSYSFIQNKINIDNVTKISMDISLPNLNWCIYKFQKVNINMVPLSVTPSKDKVMWKLTGEWLITSIDYVWKDNSMKQRGNVVRRNLGKNPAGDLPINNI
jgi:hypothetical protein